MGETKTSNQERSLPRVLDSNLRVTASPTCVSLGVASCQSEILSLKKAVWRLWPVSKSRTTSSAEGCEQLLRRAASVARPSSSPSHARSVPSRTMCGRTDPPLWGLLARFSDCVRAMGEVDLAIKVGEPQSWISRIEGGSKRRVDVAEFLALAT